MLQGLIGKRGHLSRDVAGFND